MQEMQEKKHVFDSTNLAISDGHVYAILQTIEVPTPLYIF